MADRKLIRVLCDLVVLFGGLQVFLKPVTGKKILVLSPQVGSHLLQANSVAEGLLAKGYDVYIIIDNRARLPADIINPMVRQIQYDTGHVPCFQTPNFQKYLDKDSDEDANVFEKISVKMTWFDLFYEECNKIIHNDDLYKRLLYERFDFVVTDGALRCLSIIPHRMSVPFASFMAFIPLHIPASLQGPMLIRGPWDDYISDTDNVFTKTIRIFGIMYHSLFMGGVGNYSASFISDLQKQSQLWLYDNSRIYDTTIPVSPNVIHVGGLNTRKPGPIKDKKLKQFLDSAANGFILVSFGSITKRVTEKLAEVFLATFKATPYRIVWQFNKLKLKPGQVLPSNVMALNWIPQNDVLGHENIKLFITHCGNSGQHEALYNAVPMLGIPVFGDQLHNARRMEKRWFGVFIRPAELTKQKLLDAIKQVITDSSFSENIAVASRILRDSPMSPRETAAYWIDHVIKHGADHLMSRTNQMSWFEILMIDVLLFVVLVVFLFCFVVYLLGRCIIALYRKCCCARRAAGRTKTNSKSR
jgi:UDP-N-acetylglucosamine:LPS N-acetylglucosamine transferase